MSTLKGKDKQEFTEALELIRSAHRLLRKARYVPVCHWYEPQDWKVLELQTDKLADDLRRIRIGCLIEPEVPICEEQVKDVQNRIKKYKDSH